MITRDLVKEGTEILEHAQVYTGFARVLMLEMLRESDRDMFAVYDESLDKAFVEAYQNNIQKLVQDEPLGYVLGYEWFYGYKMMVNPDVLIPRSETEELVGHVLTIIDENFDNPSIIDVACGSGAIGIALSKELNTSVIASDISAEALVVARKNNTLNHAEVTFLEGDMLEPFIQEAIKCDVLVCNPPYIKNTENIQSSVLNNEPHVALFGGEDGLYFYRKVLENAHHVLNEKALIAFEIGFDIGEAVVELATSIFSDATIECVKDMNGLDRMVFIYKGINPAD